MSDAKAESKMASGGPAGDPASAARSEAAPAPAAVVAEAGGRAPLMATRWPAQRDAAEYFGRIETGADGLPTERSQARMLKTVSVPYPLRLAWDPGTVVRKITCHRLVVASLTAVLGRILESYGSLGAVRDAGMDLYGGCYNFRPIRGGHTLSMHSYGAAIDLDPERNPLGKKWEKGKGMMPADVIAIFAEAGWTWGGKWQGRPDPMHFQAAII